MGVSMGIKGLYVNPRKLADGTTRYYYSVSRGEPSFYTTDGYRLGEGGKPMPPEFIDAYNTAKRENRRPQSGSFGRAIADYKARSAKFARMKPKGQLARAKYLDGWARMPMKNGMRAEVAPLAVFDDRGIIKRLTQHRDKIWGHSASTADEAVIALSAFLSWCKREGSLDFNRAENIEYVYQRPTEGRIWSLDEQNLFLANAPWHLRAVFTLGMYTGLRRGDLAGLPISAVSREHIIIPTGKSRGQTQAIVPIIPQLRAMLDELDQRRPDYAASPMTVLFNSHGKPWTADGLATSFDRLRIKIGLGPDKNGPTMHDFRKTAATNMVILQKQYPDLITDAVLIDMFAWKAETLSKMKRIYVSDEAVITAMTGRK